MVHEHDHEHTHEHEDNGNVDVEDYIAQVNEVRREKDAFFGTSAQSPIPASERHSGFGGLRYFAPNPDAVVEAELTPFATPERLQLGTTQGTLREQLRYGELHFTLDGQACRLTAYKDAADDDEIFIPFRDATSGKESYGAGRYLEAEVDATATGPQTVTLDFNLAYSPWCAYNEHYSCVLPPAENRLAAAVRAGEQTYHVE